MSPRKYTNKVKTSCTHASELVISFIRFTHSRNFQTRSNFPSEGYLAGAGKTAQWWRGCIVLAEDLSWASNHLQHRLQDTQLRLPGLHRHLNSRMRTWAPTHWRNNANLFKMPVRRTDCDRLFKSFCLGGNKRKFINKQHYWKCFLFCPSADRKAFIPLKSWPK